MKNKTLMEQNRKKGDAICKKGDENILFFFKKKSHTDTAQKSTEKHEDNNNLYKVETQARKKRVVVVGVIIISIDNGFQCLIGKKLNILIRIRFDHFCQCVAKRI